jgi:hypothetical protein
MAVYLYSHQLPRPMRLLSKILWSLAFIAATFVWMVLFEHGFSVDAFNKGVREEWHALTAMTSGKGGK